MSYEYNDNINKENEENKELLDKLENAYKIYKLSENYLNEVNDDYGRQKIAKLRLEFAKHELLLLLQEARDKGIKWKKYDTILKYFRKS